MSVCTHAHPASACTHPHAKTCGQVQDTVHVLTTLCCAAVRAWRGAQVSWVEKFMQVGKGITGPGAPMGKPGAGAGAAAAAAAAAASASASAPASLPAPVPAAAPALVPGSKPVPGAVQATTTGLGGFERPISVLQSLSGQGQGAHAGQAPGVPLQLHSDEPGLTVGVLHLIPSLDTFPLLDDPLG